MIPTGPHKKCLTVNYSISDDKEVIRTVDSEKKKRMVKSIRVDCKLLQYESHKKNFNCTQTGLILRPN